jgi:hypothetical protein
MKFTRKTLTLPQILDWCAANGEEEWAKNCRKEREFDVYPTETYTIKRGKKKGETSTRRVPNSSPIGKVKRIPTTRDIVEAFCEDFGAKMPAGFFPETSNIKKVTMDDLVAAFGTAKYDEVKKAYEEYQATQKKKAKK